MRSSTRICLFTCILLISTGLAATALGQTKIYDWSDDKRPVLVQNDSGLIFITKEKKPDRVYNWSSKNAGDDFDNVYLVNLDGKGGKEVLGAGKPMFVLKENGDPMWSLDKGCKQTIVADFVADDKLDVLCNNGREMKVYTDDGQFVWSVSLGHTVEHCRAGDYNGDLKADLECKYRGRDQWARIDAEGEILAKDLSKPEISEGGVDLDLASPSDEKDVLDGKEGVELDGEVLAALTKDLDGDGSSEIVAVTQKTIYVISEDGSDVQKFPASAKKYNRKPFAKLNSVYASNFSDDAKAQKTVEDLQDKLSKCYAGRVTKNQFAGTGQIILSVSVDDKGKTTGVNRVHSEISDKAVETCAKKALEAGKYPAAKEGATGSINVNMKYTFRDE
ncbi:MAG: AgmX/PglI C-terminal domain-containing protein [Persicimonas sp.]